jgi:hypothetical protein
VNPSQLGAIEQVQLASTTKGRKAVRAVCSACADDQRHAPKKTDVEVAAAYLTSHGDLWEYVMAPAGFVVRYSGQPGKHQIRKTVWGQTLLGDQLVQAHRGPPIAQCKNHGSLWVDEPTVMGAVAAFKASGRVRTMFLVPLVPASGSVRRRPSP